MNRPSIVAIVGAFSVFLLCALLILLSGCGRRAPAKVPPFPIPGGVDVVVEPTPEPIPAEPIEAALAEQYGAGATLTGPCDPRSGPLMEILFQQRVTIPCGPKEEE